MLLLPCWRGSGSGAGLGSAWRGNGRVGGLLLRVLLLVLPDLQVAAAPMKREERVRLLDWEERRISLGLGFGGDLGGLVRI